MDKTGSFLRFQETQHKQENISNVCQYTQSKNKKVPVVPQIGWKWPCKEDGMFFFLCEIKSDQPRGPPAFLFRSLRFVHLQPCQQSLPSTVN
jgi:hypothetical protein